MPRGKRTVYAMYGEETNMRLGTIRIHKKDKAEFRTLSKYNKRTRKKEKIKLKEEKHSS